MVRPAVKATMPTLVRGNNSEFHPRLIIRSAGTAPVRGFTLIEMLVVLVIIGVALGAVAVKLMPDDHSRLRDEAGRLALLLENAGLEARSSGEAMAWLPDRNGYQFWRRNAQGNWKPMEEGPYRFRAWSPGPRVVSILVGGQPFKLGQRMVLSAASFPLPFDVTLIHGSASAIIWSDGGEDVSVSTGKDANAVPQTP